MHINIMNGCLLFAWLLVTLGGVLLNLGVGLLLSGFTLIALVLFLVKKFGAYVPKTDKPHEED